jgi:integrase
VVVSATSCSNLGLGATGVPAHSRLRDLIDFRHTYGSRMAMAGVDLMTLRELMGHSSITITQRYCHPTPEHKLAAVAKLVEYNEVATKKPQSDLPVIQ